MRNTEKIMTTIDIIIKSQSLTSYDGGVTNTHRKGDGIYALNPFAKGRD